MQDPLEGIKIRCAIQPGDLGYLIYLHGLLYWQEYGLDYSFEGYVAESVAEFCRVAHAGGSRLWVAEREGTITGTIGIVRKTQEQAQLRWLLVDPDCRGIGLGRELVNIAVQYCIDRRYRHLFLWTIDFLHAAAHIYESHGFRQTATTRLHLWGQTINQVRYDLLLPQKSAAGKDAPDTAL